MMASCDRLHGGPMLQRDWLTFSHGFALCVVDNYVYDLGDLVG